MKLNPSIVTWLRCFEAAARLGTFTRAAEELHLTQSAVSQQIRQLERRVNRKLFYRSPRQIVLTDSGRFLQAQISPALHQIALALSSLTAPTGPLTISCSPSFAIRWLSPRLPDFLRKHPAIDVRIETGFYKLNRARCLMENIHVAVRLDPFEYPDLSAEELFAEYLVPVASRNYIAQFPPLKRAGTLTGTTLLHDAAAWDGAPEHIEWDTCLSALALVIDERVRHQNFNLCALATAAARSGEGIAASETAIVLDDIESGRLVPVFRKAVRIPARSRILFMDRSDMRIDGFIKWMQEACGQFVSHREQIFHRLKIQQM